MKLISLFSGIGGFELAAEWMGWTPVVSCEINPFGKKVLEHYWPKAYHHDDIKTLTYEKINEELTQRFGAEWRSDDIILTGGFPCQPYSMAGKRLGKEDERHLWPEMLRIIREVQPTWIVGENVFGLVNWNGGLVFDEVQTDLEAQGYEVQSYVLPACAVNAPHRRDRVWFVAKNTRSNGCLLGEHGQERTKDGQQWNISTRDSNGVCGEKMAGSITHTYRNPTGTPGESTSIEGIGGNNNVQQGEWRSKTELNNRPSSVSWYAPHPNGNGFNGSDSQHEVNASEGRKYAQCNFEQMGRDDSNPNSIRLRRESNWFGESGFIGKNEPPTYWQNFPTQSPVRFGDDGISSRLDRITFSKWRNESIKAAGNAIVPQVALQIFKAIQAYEK